MQSPNGTITTNQPRGGAPRISLKPDERWFYVGKTGSGKSHLARANLRVMAAKRWRVVIIEPDGLWMGKKGKPPRSGPGTVDAPRRVTKFDKSLQVQWYVPQVPAYADENLKTFLAAIMAVGDTVVYFDELYALVDHSRFSTEFLTLWTQGRKHNIAAWAAAQRPSRIPEYVMSQAENWGVFRLPTPDDIKKVAEYTASPAIRAVNLPLRYWWYYHASGDYVMDAAQLMSPIPPDGWAGFEKQQEATSGR